jgi:hypothetical protein
MSSLYEFDSANPIIGLEKLLKFHEGFKCSNAVDAGT